MVVSIRNPQGGGFFQRCRRAGLFRTVDHSFLGQEETTGCRCDLQGVKEIPRAEGGIDHLGFGVSSDGDAAAELEGGQVLE